MQEQENMFKNMDFYHLLENIKKQFLDTGLDSLKAASEKVVHKASEFLGNKTADALSQTKNKL